MWECSNNRRKIPMPWDFIVKLRPLFPHFVKRLLPNSRTLAKAAGAE
jgi:hypothetical protein